MVDFNPWYTLGSVASKCILFLFLCIIILYFASFRYLLPGVPEKSDPRKAILERNVSDQL